MLGALGAVTATAPAEVVVHAFGWRGLFAVLGALSALAALLILVVVPDCRLPTPPATTSRQPIGLMTIYSDRRFWRLAPLSAIGVGTSWSLQGLWAAPWLKDVDGFDRTGVVQTLTIMAIAVSASGLLLGLVADRLRRVGIKSEGILTGTFALSMGAQLALMLGWPVRSCIAWSAIAAAGAATVLSYAILSEYFPKQASGRANAALNLLHVGAAFLLQSLTGLLIEQWPSESGRYPIDAHQTAMAIGLLLQVGAVIWFALSTQRSPVSTISRRASRPSVTARQQAIPMASLASSASARAPHPDFGGKHAVSWRLAAVTSAILCIGLTTTLSIAISRPAIAVHIVERGR